MPFPIVEEFTKDITKVFQQWVENTILPHLSNYLTNEKKINISTEELKTIFNLPSQAPQAFTSATPFPTAMGLPNGVVTSNGAAAVAAAAKVPRGRQKTTNTGRTCKYKFGKGLKNGDICGKPELAYEYCRACIGKAGPKEELHANSVTDAMIEALKKGTNVSTIPEIVPAINTIIPTKPASLVAAPPPLGNKIPNLRLVDPAKNIYLMETDVPGAMCLRPDPSKDYYICFGVYNENVPGNIVPLSPEQKKGIESFGMTYSAPTANPSGSPPQQAALPATNVSQSQFTSPNQPVASPLFPSSQLIASPLFPSSQPIASPGMSLNMNPTMSLGSPVSPPQVMLTSVNM